MTAASTAIASLAAATSEHVTFERWTFATRRGADEAMAAFRSSGPVAHDDVESIAFLVSTTPPVSAGLLRGTTVAPTPQAVVGGLTITHSHVDPTPRLWTPPGGQLRDGAISSRPYRDHGAFAAPNRDIGLAVVVEIGFDAPKRERARAWTDLVIRALDTDPQRADGGVGARFHISEDGSLVNNLALWTDEAAYDRALQSGPPGVGQTDTAEWRSVVEFEGVRHNTVTRFAEIALR